MQKIKQKEFEKRIKVRFPTENFTILHYESLGKPAIIKCNVCQTEIQISKANNFLAPSKVFGCKNCHGLWKQREEKLDKILQYYDIINIEVKETHKYYTIKCKKCDHIRTSTLKNLYKNLKCGCETNVKRNRTAEEFINEANEYSKLGTYTLMSEYINQSNKVLLRHNTCGFIWKVRPSDVIHAHSQCPRCMKKYSKMELYITKLLEQSNIPFEKEKQLDNSRQRFDFYLEKNNLKIAIEYNGKQHYKETNFFRISLWEQQQNDNRKRKYCKEHDILLFELPYTLSEKQIYDQIMKIITKFNDYPEKEQA